jgi:hypothetical protein
MAADCQSLHCLLRVLLLQVIEPQAIARRIMTVREQLAQEWVSLKHCYSIFIHAVFPIAAFLQCCSTK